MPRRLLAALAVVLALLAAPLLASGPSRQSTSRDATSSKTASVASAVKKTGTAPKKARKANGKTKRSAAAKAAFMRQSGYPHGRPGYVVDHIVPLACGGADAPSNMQWQTVQQAKAKDKVERKKNCK